MMPTLTTTVPVLGAIDTGDNSHGPSHTIAPGSYDVEQVDCGRVWLTVDEVPDHCVIVTYAALGLVECPCCEGRGEYSYRVSEDEWDTDGCENCAGIGGVTPDEAARLQTMMDDARSGMYS